MQSQTSIGLCTGVALLFHLPGTAAWLLFNNEKRATKMKLNLQND